MPDALPLDQQYWYLEGTAARPIEVEIGAFWNQLMTDEYTDDIVRHVAEADGWLVSIFDMNEDMTTYEMHPEGDELHYVVSGAMDLLLLDDDGTETTVSMATATSAVVGRGVWHRFVVREPARGLAITAGRGTQHRPIHSPSPSEGSPQ